MRLGVISDTHKEKYYIDKAMEKLKNVDMIIHLGDNVQDVLEIQKKFKGKIANVKGNCDFQGNTPIEKLLLEEEKLIFITHGHKYDVKNGLLRLRYKALELGVEIVLYGHTHISKIDYEDGIFFVNPGSPSLPRNGFNSVAIIEINKSNIVPSIINI